jgi:hypothetical protein
MRILKVLLIAIIGTVSAVSLNSGQAIDLTQVSDEDMHNSRQNREAYFRHYAGKLTVLQGLPEAVAYLNSLDDPEIDKLVILSLRKAKGQSFGMWKILMVEALKPEPTLEATKENLRKFLRM